MCIPSCCLKLLLRVPRIVSDALSRLLNRIRFVRERGIRTLIRDHGLGGILANLGHEFAPGRHVHSMIAAAEARWAERYLRRRFIGAGQIVDLGCWLGSSTIALAKGLRANRRALANHCRVHAYDEFIWRDWMPSNFAGAQLANRYRPGDSFLDLFEQQTKKWRDLIAIHQGDLVDAEWTGGPIEFAFVDVMKNWRLTRAVLRVFFPHLLPDVSIVQHQDYAHIYTPWIPLVMYRLRDYFEPVCFVRHSSSMVFRNTGRIPLHLLTADYGFATFDDDECEAAFDYALGAVDRRGQRPIRLARIMAIAGRGDTDRAERELALFKAGGGPDATVAGVQTHLETCRRSAWGLN